MLDKDFEGMTPNKIKRVTHSETEENLIELGSVIREIGKEESIGYYIIGKESPEGLRLTMKKTNVSRAIIFLSVIAALQFSKKDIMELMELSEGGCICGKCGTDEEGITIDKLID